MTADRQERGPREGLQAIQRNFEGLSRSIQLACHGASQNASHFVSFMQSQRLHLISRTAPFAAASLQFGRAVDSGSKSKKRRKANGDEAKASKGEQNDSAKSKTEDSKAPKPKQSQQSQAELEAQKQKLKEEEQEKRREEKRQANDRRRQEAEGRRKAADERKQGAKRQQEEVARKQQQEQQKREEKERSQHKAFHEKEDKAYQNLLLEELRGIEKRRSRESDFVRSLDDVELTEDDMQTGLTPTGLRPVTKEQLTEEHDEMMRELLVEMGADADPALEDKTLSQLLDDTERERARKEMSADEPGIRKKLREEIYDEMPGEDLRPHAPKMELRIHEHEALELSALQDRFGEGHFLHPKKLLGLIPWGVVHDMSWGLFGRIPVVQDRLGPKWGAKDPELILQRQDYYDDILNIAPEMEMTVMMVAERDIPLAELRNKLLDNQHLRLRQTLYNEDELKPLDPKHKTLLAKIKLSAMEDSFRNSGLMDSNGNIKEDSKLVLVVTEDGALTAEAITPGTIVEQKIIRLGRWTDTTFARSVMDNFLGLHPADNRGKNSVGHGVLYCANGFDYRPPGKGNAYQFYDSPPRNDIPEELSRPQPQEGMILTPDIFSVERKHPFIVEDLSKAAKRTEAVAQVAT